MKKAISFMLCLLLSIGMLNIPSMNVSAKAKINVKKVQITNPNKKTLTLGKGETYNLKATVKVKPNKSKYKKVTYKSSNKKIVTVSKKGKLTAKKVGKATITVTSKSNKKKKATLKVSVTNMVRAKKLTISKTALTINEGNKVALSASISPSNTTNKGITWTTSNSRIATVNNGMVSGIQPGTVTITAKTKDGSNKSASCKVTVRQVNSIARVTTNANSYFVVTLTHPVAGLTAKDFVLKNKALANGSFLNTIEIATISTSDNINYVLIPTSSISLGTYYNVTCNKLSGVKSKSLQAIKTKMNYVSKEQDAYKVNSAVNTYFSASETTMGYTSITYKNVPAGLTARVSNSRIYFEGTLKNLVQQ